MIVSGFSSTIHRTPNSPCLPPATIGYFSLRPSASLISLSASVQPRKPLKHRSQPQGCCGAEGLYAGIKLHGLCRCILGRNFISAFWSTCLSFANMSLSRSKASRMSASESSITADFLAFAFSLLAPAKPNFSKIDIMAAASSEVTLMPSRYGLGLHPHFLQCPTPFVEQI